MKKAGPQGEADRPSMALNQKGLVQAGIVQAASAASSDAGRRIR